MRLVDIDDIRVMKFLPEDEDPSESDGEREYRNGWNDALTAIDDIQPSAEPDDAALHESCTDCPLYDHDRHSCPRFNRVIPTTILEVQQHWIPVTERLPEEVNCTGYGIQYSMDVLMTAHNSVDDETIVDYGHTTDGRWFSCTRDGYIPDNWSVLAWMPLPDFWKGEEDEP